MKLVWTFNRIPEVNSLERRDRNIARTALYKAVYGEKFGGRVRLFATLGMGIFIFLSLQITRRFFELNGMNELLVSGSFCLLWSWLYGVFLESFMVIRGREELGDIIDRLLNADKKSARDRTIIDND